jgi:putative endonuclease
MPKQGMFFVYISTNAAKTVLYVGITNDLCRRIAEHTSSKGNNSTFTGKYNVTYLIYYEEFESINDAISREKEIKGWRREKKERLIAKVNQEWKTLDCTQLQG